MSWIVIWLTYGPDYHFEYLLCADRHYHYDDVIMGAMASQITSLTIVYSTVYSGANQSKHQSSASVALVWENHRGPVSQKMFPFDDVIIWIMNFFWRTNTWKCYNTNAPFTHIDVNSESAGSTVDRLHSIWSLGPTFSFWQFSKIKMNLPNGLSLIEGLAGEHQSCEAH